jgi:anti-sigma28 factor (negative regulator of flagellin synthesis)
MIINNGQNTGLSLPSVDRSLGSPDVPPTPPPQSEHQQLVSPRDDSIALSVASRLVEQISQATEPARTHRILELKTAIEKKQYAIDPIIVSHALVEAELQGR